ncbi:calponin homology domain-containing protein [Mrakia frigida]|uniref:microtubule-binding protein BIM1 n=1 Tax=Mrakia frigida TaxID=29902 RepID=UPI003FCC25CE
MAGESRTELLSWANDLLGLSYTKVEQFGTGAAHCQILDSIYGDVPMSRVNFAARQEYEYINNFKILQNYFKTKKIDKPIPVDRLVKCKMQDNLEFLQWIRRFHDQSYGGGHYDANARRGKGGAGNAPVAGSVGRSAGSGAGMGGRVASGGLRAGSAAGGANAERMHALNEELANLKGSVDGLETERDFYFAKLRDIELIVQEKLGDPSAGESEKGTLTKIQDILYSTEEGFEVPEADLVAEGGAPGQEDETF